VLLAGDLNATAWSHSFQELTRTSGLLDSQQGFGLQPSWPASLLPLGIPIDHALHTSGLCVIKRRLGSPTGSDHRPIILDFSFKSETGWLEADSHSYDIKSTNDNPRMPK
jgi:endonuclease/exonuclease/phosphatase (EEP) superfamily protein YafD